MVPNTAMVSYTLITQHAVGSHFIYVGLYITQLDRSWTKRCGSLRARPEDGGLFGVGAGIMELGFGN